MPPASPDFVFATCQVGAERALKAEVARVHPDLRSAFGRPGLVTWKSPAPVDARFDLSSIFARAFGVALGPADSVEAVITLAGTVSRGRPMRLHVYPRDSRHPSADAAAESETESTARATRAALVEKAPGLLASGDKPARDGEHVLDVIVAPGEPFFVGHHIQGRHHSPHPGGQFPVEVPPDAPSRAYRKIEEAIAWSGAELKPGQVAVEIGSAPGGASLALLRRGLEVVGVDPGAMAPAVTQSPRFRHVQSTVAELRLEQLPAEVDWLVLDVNLAPQVALHAVRGLVAARRGSLRGVLFTLKLNDWSLADRVPALLKRVAAMGLVDVRATQLPSNRQEIFVFARAAPR